MNLLEHLRALDIDPRRPLLVHSSMKSLGWIEGGPDAVIDALMRLMHIGEPEQGLLILPTHSWADESNPGNLFDVDAEPSCVGLISETFRKRAGVMRSRHPSHSVAAIGEGAEAYLALDDEIVTPCGPEGCWGQLGRMNAQLLFLGCDLTRNTFVHSVEEMANVANRLGKSTAVTVRQRGAEDRVIPMCPHNAPCGDVSKNYIKLTESLVAMRAARRGKVAQAEVLVVEAAQCQQLALSLLEDDPDYFLTP